MGDCGGGPVSQEQPGGHSIPYLTRNTTTLPNTRVCVCVAQEDLISEPERSHAASSGDTHTQDFPPIIQLTVIPRMK